MHSVRRGLGLVGAMAVVGGALGGAWGCILPLGCGVGPAPGFQGVNDAGVVVFEATVVGSSDTLAIPVQDTADTDETITGATFSGADSASFTLLTTFPLAVPAGQSVNVQVQFTPTATGIATTTLVLQTASMGPSPMELQGVGE